MTRHTRKKSTVAGIVELSSTRPRSAPGPHGFELLEPRPEQCAYKAKLRSLGWDVLVCKDLCGASIVIDAYRTRRATCGALLCDCCGARWESARVLEMRKQRKQRKQRKRPCQKTEG